MPTHIQWSLFARHESGYLLCEETACEIIDALEEYVTDWHTDTPVGDHICSFLTTWKNGYASITDAIAEYARRAPAILFRLECHNEDEDWYQHILFHGNEREALDGFISYEKPQRIMYDDPAPAPKVMIVSQSGAVQGVFADSIESADVTLVDLDLDKLDAAADDERIDTMAWINDQLTHSKSMNCLYGSVIRRVDK